MIFADVLARPLLDILIALYEWPGTGRPDYRILPQLAWTLERRWQQPLTATRVFFASRKSINIFGGFVVTTRMLAMFKKKKKKELRSSDKGTA